MSESRPGSMSALSFLGSTDAYEDEASIESKSDELLTPLGEMLLCHARMVICGRDGLGHQYICPAMLHRLEALPLHSIGLPELGSDPNSRSAEEALVRIFSEARRACPSVVYFPHAVIFKGARGRE